MQDARGFSTLTPAPPAAGGLLPREWLVTLERLAIGSWFSLAIGSWFSLAEFMSLCRFGSC